MRHRLLITITMLTMSAQTYGQEILAKKEGSFEKFNTCSLERASGTIKLNSTVNFTLEETSKYRSSFYDYENLVAPAVLGAMPVTYRWNHIQVDYLIKGPDKFLTHFFSYGFRNIRNESSEAEELIGRIDTVCDEELMDFKILGEFQIDLKIGNRVFQDKLIVTRVSDDNFIEVKGRYIVPNSFESKIKKLDYINGNFTFVIEVKEGSDQYDAIFKGEFLPSGGMQGNAYVLPDLQPLGSFTGKRL